MLAPFHIGRDKNGDKVHGLQTVRKIWDEYAWGKQLPVLMPTSIFGKAAFEIDLPQFSAAHPTEKILVIEEEDLDVPGLAKNRGSHRPVVLFSSGPGVVRAARKQDPDGGVFPLFTIDQ